MKDSMKSEWDKAIEDQFRKAVELSNDLRLASDQDTEGDLLVLVEHLLVMYRLAKRRRTDDEKVLAHYREDWVPRVNKSFRTGIRICAECGDLCLPGRKYCSSSCSSRKRNRGRGKTARGRSAAENALSRRKAKLESHRKRCPTCQQGVYCQKWSELADDMMAAENLATREVQMDPEEAQALNQREKAGRTPKRSTDPTGRSSMSTFAIRRGRSR